MVELFIIIVVLWLLIAVAGALIALRLQYRSLDSTRQEREGWQQAQEGRQRTWEVRQGKHILEAEKKLADQLKEARREWRDWSVEVRQEHQEWRNEVDLEQELANLPHVEHIEVTPQSSGGRLQPKNWRPAGLYRANLNGRDLSYRYLERADLRETQLTEANFYMADLSGASLTGANLQEASLIGANLSGVDLRGANLAGANLLVADLHNAVLHGTNLAGAYNLTPEQLQTAIYDSTTIIDSAIDITLPRIPGVQITPSSLLRATPVAGQLTSTPMTIPETPEPDMSLVSAEEATANILPAPLEESVDDKAALVNTDENIVSLPLADLSSEEAVLAVAVEEMLPAAQSEEVMSPVAVEETLPAAQSEEAVLTVAVEEILPAAQSEEAVLTVAVEEMLSAAQSEEAVLTVAVEEILPAAQSEEAVLTVAVEETLSAAQSEEAVLTVAVEEMLPAAQSEEAVLTVAVENVLPVYVAETPEVVTNEDSGAAVLESVMPGSEENKKGRFTRKRTGKAKAVAATPPQSRQSSKQDETYLEKPDEGCESAQTEEVEEEELLPNKIIQLQTRTSKTRPLPGSGEQSQGEPQQKKRGSSRATSFPNTTSNEENQHAQAN